MIGRPALVVYISVFIYETGVIEDVAFHAVYYLYIFSLALQLFCGFSRVREGLHHSVVRYSYCRLSPGGRLIDNI